MRGTSVLLLLILVLPLTIFANNELPAGTIKGLVTTTDGNPAPSVSVVIRKIKKNTITNESGIFIMKDVPAGSYDVEVSLIGFATAHQAVTVEAGQTAQITVQLSVTDKQLQEVEITTGRNKFAKKETDQVARMQLSNLENPQVYSMISKELMSEQIITDYRDAVRNVTGTNALEQVSNGRTSAIIRGFRTPNFIRNGMATNQLTTIDVSNVERIEIIKGPSGTLFGSGFISYGGVVNRVTKKPMDSFKGDITYTAGSYGLSRLTVDINTPLDSSKKALLRVNAARSSQESFQENGFQRNYFFSPSISYQFNDKLSVVADLELYRNYGTNVGIGITPNTTLFPQVKNFKDMKQHYKRTYSADDITSTFPGYNFYGRIHYKFNNKWSSSTAYNYGGVDARNQLQYTPTLISADLLTRTVQKYSHHYYSVQLQEYINGEFNIGGVRNRVVIGGDFTADVTKPTYTQRFLYDTVNYRTGAIPLITSEKINQRLSQLPMNSYFESKIYMYDVYASDVVNITDRLIVMLSLRLDKVDNKGSHNLLRDTTTGAFTKTNLSPKLGVVYQIIKDQLSVFGNYLNGFNYTATTDRQGNTFKPEQANQLEGGVKLEMFEQRLTATATYYDIEVSDKLRVDPNDINFQIQDGTQRSKGFEAEVIANPVPGLNIIAGYAYNDSKFTKSAKNIQGKTPGRAPHNMINGYISYHLTNGKAKGLGFGVGGNYSGDSYYDDLNTFVNPAFTVFNCNLFYDQPRFRVAVKSDNLTDQYYWGPYGNPQPPRSFAASVTVKF